MAPVLLLWTWVTVCGGGCTDKLGGDAGVDLSVVESPGRSNWFIS